MEDMAATVPAAHIILKRMQTRHNKSKWIKLWERLQTTNSWSEQKYVLLSSSVQTTRQTDGRLTVIILYERKYNTYTVRNDSKNIWNIQNSHPVKY